MRLVGPLTSGPAVGADDAALADKDSTQPICGTLLGVYVKYTVDSATGVDVVVKTKGDSAPSYNLLALTDAVTDGLFLPRKEVVDQAGAALVFAGSDGVPGKIPFDDIVNVAIDDADADDLVEVWLFLE